MSESTLVVCSECGEGNFACTSAVFGTFVCTVCASEVVWADILPNLGADDDAFVVDGLMHVRSTS